MWEEILRLAVGNGLWAVLFCALLVYLLKDSRARENKYQKIITDLNLHLNTVNEINEKIDALSSKISRCAKKSNKIETAEES